MRHIRSLVRRYPLVSAALACGALSVLMFVLGWLSRQHGPQQGPRALAAPALASLLYPAPRITGHASAPALATTMPRPSPSAAGPAASAGAGSAVAGHAATANQAGPLAPVPANPETGRADPFEPVVDSVASLATGSDRSPAAPAAAAEIQAAIKRSEPGLGRINPFDPLISASVQFSPRAGAGMAIPLPPIPPLDPNGPMPATGAAGQIPPIPTVRDLAPPSGLRLLGFAAGRTAFALIEEGGKSFLAAPGDLIRPGLRVVAVDAGRQAVRLEWQGTPLVLSAGISTGP